MNSNDANKIVHATILLAQMLLKMSESYTKITCTFSIIIFLQLEIKIRRNCRDNYNINYMNKLVHREDVEKD